MEQRKNPAKYEVKITIDPLPIYPLPGDIRKFEDVHLSGEEPPRLKDPGVFPYPKILNPCRRGEQHFLKLCPSN
jgi:hypothetical protein